MGSHVHAQTDAGRLRRPGVAEALRVEDRRRMLKGSTCEVQFGLSSTRLTGSTNACSRRALALTPFGVSRVRAAARIRSGVNRRGRISNPQTRPAVVHFANMSSSNSKRDEKNSIPPGVAREAEALTDAAAEAAER